MYRAIIRFDGYFIKPPHNLFHLILWSLLPHLLIKALEQKKLMEEEAKQMLEQAKMGFGDEQDDEIFLAIKTIQAVLFTSRAKRCVRGIKRFVHQIFSLSGKLIIEKGQIKQIILNSLYPLINRFLPCIGGAFRTFRDKRVTGVNSKVYLRFCNLCNYLKRSCHKDKKLLKEKAKTCFIWTKFR